MKTTVNFSDFVDAFRRYDRYDSFGYDGLRIIFDYLEEYEESTGEDVELDVIAICCDYNMNDAETIAQDYGIDLSEYTNDDEKHDTVMDYLNENTTVLGECKDGIIYQCF